MRSLWLREASALALFAASAAQAGIVSHFKFDEFGGTLAFDGTGTYYGSLEGSAKFETGGISGGCVSMDIAGKGLVNFWDSYPLTDGDFTISVWAKTPPGDRTDSMIVVGRHISTVMAGYIVGINMSGGAYGQTDKAWFYQSASPGDCPVSATTVNDGQWHLLTATYTAGGECSLYVDGAPVESTRTALPIKPVSAPFLVGGIVFGSTPTSLFNGEVDDLQIYDEALGCQEVQYLYDHPGKNLAESCYADCNGDGKVNINDFICFQGHFSRREVQADCDCSATFSVNDFICFQRAFAGACK